jgi:hypothetical protein
MIDKIAWNIVNSNLRTALCIVFAQNVERRGFKELNAKCCTINAQEKNRETGVTPCITKSLALNIQKKLLNLP